MTPAPSNQAVSETPVPAFTPPKLPEPPAVLTQEGPEGIRFDFNEGCRLELPQGQDWHVRLRDLETDTVLFDQLLKNGGLVQSGRKSYVRFELTVWKDGQDAPILTHRLDLAGRDVLVRMELGGLGDHLSWVGHAVAFARKHGARVTCCVRADMVALLAPIHPDMRSEVRFVAPGDESDRSYYASYKVLVFFDDKNRSWQPLDYRQAGLAQMGAYMLGLTPQERRPDILPDPGGAPIKGPYVAIAVQGSGLAKKWNNPGGWRAVIAALKELGYRVVCIDQKRVAGAGTVWTHVPHGVEDETGDRPLAERARWLKHADFFIGLSSGLSWLAWAAGARVVMIGGFTETYNEFHTPWRVINRNVCHGCANDVTKRLDLTDFFFCPDHKGTERAVECSRMIAPRQVIDAVYDLVLSLPAQKRKRLTLSCAVPARLPNELPTGLPGETREEKREETTP